MSRSENLKRALAGYDHEFETRMLDALTRTIAAESMINDSGQRPVMVLRLGEIAGALMVCLASTLALSPVAARDRHAIKVLVKQFEKRLKSSIASAGANPLFADFKNRTFNETDRARGGRA